MCGENFLKRFVENLKGSEMPEGSENIYWEDGSEISLSLMLLVEKFGRIITARDFKMLGFDSPKEFYFLRCELREDFLDRILELCDKNTENFDSEIKELAEQYITEEKRLRLLEEIENLMEILKKYQNSDLKRGARPYIEWEDGSQLGYGFASHLGRRHIIDFEKMGFKDMYEFYSVEKKVREKFLRMGVELHKNIFGENPENLPYEELKKRYEIFVERLKKIAEVAKMYVIKKSRS